MKISYLKSSPSLVEVLKNNYEAFINQKYKFSHCGLFHDEKNIYAVIKNLEECNTTLDEIQKLYDHEFRTLGVPGPIFIGGKRDDFIKIDFRNIPK